MMIGKFHKLIQSRILWAVFLVVIVFTFVIWGTQLPGERNRRTAETSPGLLDGKPVDAEDFQSAFAHTYAALYMMYGRELPNTTAFREKIRESAWERLVALRLADHLDIRVSDAEVLAMVQAQEGFKRDGRFDINLYRQQVSQALEPLGLGLRFFEEHVRQEIALQRLAELSSETYLLPPLDLHRMLATITDRFDLRMVAFGMDSVGPVPDPTREEILAYFARASERYRVPAKAKIRLVRFQADPDAADLSDPDSEDVQDFYEENRNRFWVAARQATETEEAQPARFRPLDEVRPELISAMRAEAARARALREAERFVGLIAPMQREAAALSFDEAAEKMKVIPADFGPFSAADGRETAGVSPAIVRAAMDLLPEEPVSSVIPDGNDAVALLVTERIPSRIPELDEVLDRVTLDAKQEAVQRTLIRRV
ncbi:MAG: peptidylprolyl isomerase, partial [Kiritimatiellia bacterium]|nr:peptidylprolyl isomerase [Kiritimatiellia bacterium]